MAELQSSATDDANARLHPDNLRGLVACPHCDLLLQKKALRYSEKAKCPRCDCLLQQKKKNSIERTFAVALAGLIAFFPAMTLPLLGLRAGGLENEASLVECIQAVLKNELYFAGLLILLFCVLAPLFRLLIIFYLTSYVMNGKEAPYGVELLRFFHELEEWGMLEVFLLGLVVSLYKIIGLADAVFGFGLVAFVMVLMASTMATYFLDEQLLWEQLHGQ